MKAVSCFIDISVLYIHLYKFSLSVSLVSYAVSYYFCLNFSYCLVSDVSWLIYFRSYWRCRKVIWTDLLWYRMCSTVWYICFYCTFKFHIMLHSKIIICIMHNFIFSVISNGFEAVTQQDPLTHRYLQKLLHVYHICTGGNTG